MKKIGLAALILLFTAGAVQAEWLPGKQMGVVNTTMTSADTEYTVTVPAGTRSFTLINNSGVAFRVAAGTGAVATPTGNYAAIPAGSSYYETNVNLGVKTMTIYVAADAAGTVMSLIYWY